MLPRRSDQKPDAERECESPNVSEANYPANARARTTLVLRQGVNGREWRYTCKWSGASLARGCESSDPGLLLDLKSNQPRRPVALFEKPGSRLFWRRGSHRNRKSESAICKAADDDARGQADSKRSIRTGSYIIAGVASIVNYALFRLSRPQTPTARVASVLKLCLAGAVLLGAKLAGTAGQSFVKRPPRQKGSLSL